MEKSFEEDKMKGKYSWFFSFKVKKNSQKRFVKVQKQKKLEVKKCREIKKTGFRTPKKGVYRDFFKKYRDKTVLL